MVPFHHYRIILVICLILVEQLMCQKNVARYGQQTNQETNLLQTLPSRLDNRNSIMDQLPVFRSKPKCNKRIRIANGVTRFRDRGSFVRYACSHGFTLLGATIAVCLRDDWSEPPPICVRPGCRRVLAPNNGVARLAYSGAVANFICKTDHQLEGSRVLYCDGNRWNDTEPVCIPINPPTTSTEVWEWPQPPTTEKVENENVSELSPEENLQSWDYNTGTPSPINSTSTETPHNFTLLPEHSLSPISSTHHNNYNNFTTTKSPSEDDTVTNPVPEETTMSPPFLNRTTASPSISEFSFVKPTSKSVDIELITVPESTTKNLPLISTTAYEPTTLSSPSSTATSSVTTTERSLMPELRKTSMSKIDVPKTTTPTPEFPTTKKVETETTTKFKTSGPSTTTENWEDPFPDHTLEKFDQELEAVANNYETKDLGVSTIPEFIQPISPHKLDDDGDYEFYKKWVHVSIVGGIVVGILGGVSLVGGMATYFWRKKVGIARANQNDQDGRTLSASDANEDFMWMDSRDHRMSRL